MHLHAWETRSLIFFWRVSHTCFRDSICVTRLIHMCDMSHQYAWLDLLICVTYLYDSLKCATWPMSMCARLIHMCNMWHICMCNTMHVCVRSESLTDLSSTHVWYELFICISSHVKDRCVVYEWFMNHSYVCHMYLILMIHIIHYMNPIHTYERFMSFITWILDMWCIRMIHFTHVNDSCHIYEWFISHICTYEWFISHIRMICGVYSQALAIWLTNMCDMVHWHCDRAYQHVWHSSLTCVTWLIDICDMTHCNVWCDSIKCVTWCRSREGVTWLTDMCDITHWNVWNDSPTRVTRLNDMRDMTNWNV